MRKKREVMTCNSIQTSKLFIAAKYLRLRAPIKNEKFITKHFILEGACIHLIIVPASSRTFYGTRQLLPYLKVKLLVTVEDQYKPPQLVTQSLD